MTRRMLRGRRLAEPRHLPIFPARPEWMFHPDRPCQDNPLWTSDDRTDLTDAARLCHIRACPVLQECGRWAVSNQEKHHVWGGMVFSTAETQTLVAEVSGRERKGAGRQPDAEVDAQVRELWAAGLGDPAIALRLGKWPGSIANIRKRLGLDANHGRQPRAEAAA